MGSQNESIRVLVTGAGGRIAEAFRRHAADRYRLRLAAHHVEKLGDVGSCEVCSLELADPASCLAACEGIHTVVHMGGSPSPKADFYNQLLDSNIKGTYNILTAAKRQGCRRVVLASSVQAVVGYPLDVQVHEDSPVRPLNMYGVCKCFSEAAAHYFAWSEDLPCVVIRIGNFEWARISKAFHARNLSAFISAPDMCQLLVRCIETPGIRFAIAHGVSNNRFKYLDIESTRKTFGYEPQDDAFRIAGVNLTYTRQWVTGKHDRGLFQPTDGE